MTENNSINSVLVPNNNTSECMRVFGLSFGNGDGAAALGYPVRDAACDYESAADDAAASGNHDIAWFWRCQKKNMQKIFGAKKFMLWQKHDAGAATRCYNQMSEGLSMAETIKTLQEANAQLMSQRASDQATCDNAVDRANERTGRCEQQLFEDK